MILSYQFLAWVPGSFEKKGRKKHEEGARKAGADWDRDLSNGIQHPKIPVGN